MVYSLINYFFDLLIRDVLNAVGGFLDPLFELVDKGLAIAALRGVVRRKGHDADLFLLPKRPAKHALHGLTRIGRKLMDLLNDDVLH